MTKAKKSLRFLTSFTLVFAMVLSIASLTASAAGTETWYSGFVAEAPFTTTGYNLTPTKTIGDSGKLIINATYRVVDSDKYSTPVNCTLEIRDLNGNVLATTNTTFSSKLLIPLSLNVTQGQKIRLYMDAYDATTGVARRVQITYSHSIT